MPEVKVKSLWITWEYQVRNRSMAKRFGAELHEIVEDDKSKFGRYWKCAKKTYTLIKVKQPDFVFHQNPSVFLGLWLIFLRAFFRFKLVSDTHNGGLFPAEGRFPVLNCLGRFVSLRTDVLIVHNEAIAEFCRGVGKRAFVIPDPLPDIPRSDVDVKENKLVFVTRWADDEPHEMVISAFSELKDQMPSVELNITGRPPQDFDQGALPEGVTLTGFVSSDEYNRLLNTSSMMLVLTNRSDSLNCGGYEAMAISKPCVLSDTPVLRDFFGDSFLYTGLTEEELIETIKNGLAVQPLLVKKMDAAKAAYLSSYEERLSGIYEELERLGFRCN